MIWLVASLLLMAVMAYMMYPLIRPPQERAEDEGEGERSSSKEALQSAMEELQFDFEMGKLSPEEHRELEEKYRARALSALQGLDLLSPTGKEGMEGEVAALRQVLKERRFCSRCGSSAGPGDSFCSHCGALLKGKKK